MGLTARLARLTGRRHTIRVEDPHGHIAKALGVRWLPGATLVLEVKCRAEVAQDVRAYFEGVAEGQLTVPIHSQIVLSS